MTANGGHILEKVIEALGITKNDFQQALKYKSYTSVHRLFKSDKPLPGKLTTKIILAFPNVSHKFLSREEGEPLLFGPEAINQKNIFNMGAKKRSEIEILLSLDEKIDKALYKLNTETRTSLLSEVKDNQVKILDEISQIKGLLAGLKSV